MLKDQQTQLLGLQSAVRLMEQDFVQAAARPVRQAVGDDPPQLAFAGSPPGTQPVVALTRTGWANPAGLQRPGLQRVAYFLENGTLRREYWNVLDPTLASTTIKHDLLTHVKSFTLRYLDVNHNWQPQWPPTTSCVGCATQEQTLRQRPLAVRSPSIPRIGARSCASSRSPHERDHRAPQASRGLPGSRRAQRGLALLVAILSWRSAP